MLYALGEIVLVVIGILLALQINTWNENKKANKLEIEMLLELKAGLETDVEALQRDFNNIQELYESRMTIINWIESKKLFSDSLSVYMSKIFF